MYESDASNSANLNRYGLAVSFEWDAEKAIANLEKHGLSFEEASTAFGDPLSRTVRDPLHSDEEERFVIVGMTSAGRLVVVVHTDVARACV